MVSTVQSIDVLMIGDIPCQSVHVPCIRADNDSESQRYAQSHDLDRGVQLVS